MKQPKIPKKAKIAIIALTIIFSLALFAYMYDKIVIPCVVHISRQYAVTEINKSINDSIASCIEEENIKSSDFIFNDNKSISADAVLINKVCAKSAEKISKELNNIKIPNANINLSMLSNVFSLFNIKFGYNVDVASIGSAQVDYETEFVSAGINRTNFKVWLNVYSEVLIVDFFHTEKLSLNRKIMIINTIIDGDVPSTYLQIPQANS